MTAAQFTSALDRFSALPTEMLAHLRALSERMTEDDRAECLRVIAAEYDGIVEDQKAILGLVEEGEKELREFARHTLPGMRRAIEEGQKPDVDSLFDDE